MKKLLLLSFMMVICIGLFSQQYDLLDSKRQPKGLDESIEHLDASFFKIDNSELKRLRKDIPERIVVPVLSRGVNVELYRKEITSGDFKVTTASGKSHKLKPVYTYSGTIQGQPSSFAVLSITEENLTGVIHDEKGNSFTIGEVAEGKRIAMIEESSLSTQQSNALKDDALEIPSNEQPSQYENVTQGRATENKCKVVEIYFEASHKMYLDRGGKVEPVAEYIQGLFSVVALLYENIGVNVKISEIKVWDKEDPYQYNSSSGALYSFQDEMEKGFNGDLAHLLSTELGGLGGVAFVNALCASPKFKIAFSNISNSFNQFPAYSWTVNVVAHEIGHNLGSPHTHSCSWGEGALDDCYSPSGTCQKGPTPVGGGTIMSYCHLTKNGVSFAKGFHPAVQQRILARIAGSPCIPYEDCNTEIIKPNLTRKTDNLTIESESIDIDFTVTNNGNQAANQSKIGFFLSEDQQMTVDDIFIGSVDVPILTVSTDYTGSFEATPQGLSAGDYYIGYIIDFENTVDEFSETDNKFRWNDLYVVEAEGDYCHSEGENTQFERIGSVQIAEYINQSGDNDGYGDFTGEIIKIAEGTPSAKIILTPEHPNATKYRENWRIWIDYNGDGDFADEGELVFSADRKTGAVEGEIKFSKSIKADSTRMRVSMMYRSSNTFIQEPCSVFPFGEVKDYTIIFNADQVCPNPVPLFFSGDVVQGSTGIVFSDVDNSDGYFLRWRPQGGDWSQLAVPESTATLKSLNFEFQLKSSCADEFSPIYRISYE